MELNYKDIDHRYVERAICMEEFYIQEPGKRKFYIPSLMPFIAGGKPNEKPVKVSNSHLINKNKPSGGMLNSRNYIEIDLPNYITAPLRDIEIEFKLEITYDGCTAPEGGGKSEPGNFEYTYEFIIKRIYFYDVDGREYVSENKEFMIEFIGGDINNPRVVERYN